ncbi:MAG: hypothetical protein Q9218_007608 [Villophora microphyllina]
MTRLIEPRQYIRNRHRARHLSDSSNYPAQRREVARIDAAVSSVIHPHKINTIWNSAAGPHTNQAVFAVGTSKGVMVVGLKGNTAQTWEQECHWPGDESAAETLAVDFWQPDVVLAGMRSGKVRMWDLRSGGATVRFQHASCVVNVRALDQNKILVAGHKDKVCIFMPPFLQLTEKAQLCIYDARFIKGFPQDQQSEILTPSRPIHTFPTYRMESFVYPRLGFDVHQNLIVVGTEDKKVQLFDIKSGREVAIGQQSNPPRLTDHASCVQFVEDEYAGDGLRLLVANGPCIDTWAW